MPRATVDTSSTKRFELQSLEDGWVELRKLSYGQILERREIAGKMAIEGIGSDGRPQGTERLNIEMLQRVVTAFEFKHSIVDHNLEDENDRKLNFGDPHTLETLDPRIGQELAELIDNLNSWETDSPGKEPVILETESEQALS